MLRHVMALATLSGCNLVFGVDHEAVPAVCGPYAVVEQLAFDPSLKDVRELSIDRAGTHAMAWADYQGTLGPNALTNVNGVWTADAPRSVGLETLGGARMLWDGTRLFGWTFPNISEYQFTTVGAGQAWAAVNPVVDVGTTDDKIAGNAIELPLGTGVLRLLVETRIPAVGRSQIVIRSLSPADENWQSTERLDALTRAMPPITPSLGLLTANGDRLVYAATVGDDPRSRLYASRADVDNVSFGPGEPLQIEGVDDVDLTEPWINPDCSELWFNAGGTIQHARQLVAPDTAQ